MVPRLRETSTIVKIALVIWILSAVFTMVLLNKIDGIVHGDLYEYGLQFSFGWATSYWALLRLAFVCLAAPSVLSVIVLASDFLKKDSGHRPVSASQVKPNSGLAETHKENNMVINCPKCGKMFYKPLSMLDFSTGKAKLVSVCPYCSNILGRSDEKIPDNIQILEPEKKEADR